MVMEGVTLSAFSVCSKKKQDLVKVPAEAAGPCQRAAHVFWAPLCALALVTLSNLSVKGGGAPHESLDTSAVALVVVGPSI